LNLKGKPTQWKAPFFGSSCLIVKNHNGNGVKVRQLQRKVKNHNVNRGVKGGAPS
jgi:hypothetical protein